MPVTVDGATELVSGLRQAGDQLDDASEAAAAAASIIARAARPPRVTGRLAGSARTSSSAHVATVTYDAPYAALINWGYQARGIHPTYFLTDAAQATEPAWQEAYTEHMQTVLDDIHGA